MARLNTASWLAVLAIAGVSSQYAQQPSRAALIQAQQEAKAASPRSDTPNRLERWLLRFQEERVLERFAEGVGGFRARLGGLAPGSGLAAGPEYRRTGLAGGRFEMRASAQSSTRGYRRYDLHTALPRLAGGRLFSEFYAARHDYPGLNYYGPGASSQKTGRTDFHLQDAALDATLGLRPARHLSAGGSLGYLFNNVGPGTDSRFASTDAVFRPSQAPGIDRQTNFLHTGAFLQYDWRDDAAGPRRGGNYFIRFGDYRDQALGSHDFRRLDLEAQQYLPLLNQRRVLAFRAKSTLTFRDRGQVIPFYMQPTLGGSDDLRGYRPFRFRGDNLFVANGEYRWEVFSGLDMALFADAGQVFARRSDFDGSAFNTDAGFGFRFNVRNQTFLRLDVGFSHEGFQVWVKFNDIFKKGPVHTSSSMGDF